MIKPLPNPDCFFAILKAINDARSSVIVVNYIAEFSSDIVRAKSRTDDPVAKLADALVRAHRRGVKVSAILEGSRFNDNYPFYRHLKDKGVDAWLDTSITLIHHKAVLIDDDILITGSNNFSYAAFFKNEEFSILTDDKNTIAVFKEKLKKITSQREEMRVLKSMGFIKLPLQLMNKVVFPLFSVHAAHSFNLYMLLVSEDGGRPRPIPIKEEEWGRYLGFDPADAGRNVTESYKKYYYTQRLNSVLGQLKRSDLIEVDRKKDTVIRLSLRGAQATKQSPDRIEIPLEFWKFGWLSRLSFPAKTFYFVSLMKTTDSPFYPWWSSSMKRLTKQFGIAHTIDDGVHELENYNIIEVLRGIPVKRGEFYSEEAHFYRLNPFYDMALFESKLAALEREYSKDRIQKSIAVAKTFWAAHNLDSLKIIAGHIEKIGWPKVKRAAAKISRLPTSSSRKCLGYLEELLS